ncbi:MAG: DNA repair protein RecN, partial [Acidobacteria bacterium]
MLKYLRIRNLAVISDVEIEPEPGLNLLTGETGSGKSIIVDAVSLLMGARASQEMLRTGASEAWVEGIFSIESTSPVRNCLARAGMEVSPNEMIIRRHIHRDGRTRAFINDRLVTVSLLREVRPYLVDIHGQGDYQSLLAPGAQLDLLDEVADAMELRAEVNAVCRRYRERWKELQALMGSEAERLRMIDMYRFQIDEIERVNPRPGEDEELEKERRLLHRAEELLRLASEAYERLYEADDAALTMIARVGHLVERLCEIDDRFEPLVGYLESARAGLEEASIFLREYVAGMTASPDRLEWVEERLAELSRLKRKYGPRLSDVIDRWNEMKVKLERLTSSAASREELERHLSALEREYLERARLLTERRKKAARWLAERVMDEMKALAMEHGRMVVTFRPVRDVPAENGMERVEFMV